VREIICLINMLKLPNVTLIAFTGKNIAGHQKALDYSRREIEFGAVKLIEKDSPTIDDWNKSIVYDLGDHVDTEFAILCHDDGFIVNPDNWNPEWLQYDYIGSPWPLPTDDYSYRDVNGHIQRVGNSVGLRSKKLLDLPKKLGMEWKSYYGNTNEDGFISVHNKHIFEEHGCKFAPFEVAIEFARETTLPENIGVKPFMFHRYAGENATYPKFK
jgi:hypothetical protein